MLKTEEKDKYYMVSLIVESRKIKEIETNSKFCLFVSVSVRGDC